MLKIADESVHDVLRFTILFDHDNFTLKYLKAEQFLRKNKMYFVKVKNTFNAVDTYKGINTFVMAKDEKYNYIFELQFHTRESFDAKMKTHEYYETERNSMSSQTQKDEAHEAQARIFAAVQSPSNYDMIKEFDMLNSENIGIIKE